MGDPDEGLDARGFITTGAADDRLRDPFTDVIAAARAACHSALPSMHSLYVYGSVATGHARAPSSDLDLLGVVDGQGDAHHARRVAAELTSTHRMVVREVSLAVASLEAVHADSADGLAWRCFIKHYCVCVAGEDLSPQLSRCRPSGPLVAGLTADTRAVLDRARQHAVTDPPAAAQAAARKLLLTAATIASLRTGGWTTDRQQGAAWLAERWPEHRVQIRHALTWSKPGQGADVSAGAVLAFVDGFGTRVLSLRATTAAAGEAPHVP